MGKKLIILVWIVAFVATLFIAISPQSLSPPSAPTNHTPVCQFAYQQSLSAVHRTLHLAPFSFRDVSSVSRACYPPELQVFCAERFRQDLTNLGIDWTFSVLHF